MMVPFPVLLIAATAATIGLTRAADRPNILFIAIDDLGAAVGCYGDATASTPHLDRLAASGVLFDRAYCQIPLCNPSRASLMTGLRPDTTTVYDLTRHFREALPEVITIPQLFQKKGWFTARVGKLYHYDVPKGIGTAGLDDPPSWDETVNPKGRDVAEESLITNPLPEKPVSAALSWLAAEGTDEEQTDGLVASEAIRLLGEHHDEPFFLGVGFFRPHTPFVAPKKYFDLHPLDEITLPSASADDREDIPDAAFAHNNPTPNYGLDEETLRRALQAYRASVSFVDAQVGRVLDSLDQLGLTDKTIVVLWSDHGYHLGEHLGVWQKRTLFEESTRTPMIVRVPGAAGNGRTCSRIVEFVDMYPTLADLAGLTPPSNLAGASLRPLLDDPTAPWDRPAFSQILRPANDRFPAPVMGRSIRTERWRYTEWDEGRTGAELYDHEADPHEFYNLAHEPDATTQAVISKLKTRFKQSVSGTAPNSPVNEAKL